MPIKAIIDQTGSPDTPEFNQIARVTVIKTLDPFINAITSGFNVRDNAIIISNCNINGILVESGIILEAHRPSQEVVNKRL